MTPFPIEPARALGPMRVVLTTYPDRARALAAVDGALERRLAACAQLVAVDSRYWWKDRRESAEELLVVFKTVPKRVGRLLEFLAERHPYDVPELLELDVPRVAAPYLGYLEGVLGAERRLDARSPRRRGGPRARGARGPGRTRAPPRRRSR